MATPAVRNLEDDVVRRLEHFFALTADATCHCEERSDEAISNP